MGLKVNKLENVEYRGSQIIARCPACAEQGRDNKGDHLSIDDEGRFGCVVYPGKIGADHRKRIFALVGVIDGNGKSCSQPQNKMINVKKVNLNHGTVIKTDILGRLGRVNQTYAGMEKKDIKDGIYVKEFEKGVPSVPNKEDDIKTDGSMADIEEKAIDPSVEKSCKCGRRATTFDFGEIKNGKHDWTFYCSSCNPQNEIMEGAISGTVEPGETKACAKCGKPGQRYCYGEVTPGKYNWGRFCLVCYPHHF